ncbi:MAG: ABC transporter ATP-binding protein [Treponema sp.]|nr:ABC transporter ATP-binding protein [Treponema sp.]
MIKIENLTKSFITPQGKLTVLDKLSFEIPDKTFLGICGKSGAGKSTLLFLFAGLQKPDQGNITIDDQTQITNLSENELAAFRNKNIGFVSQEQSFLENLTVLDNVRLPAYLGKEIPNQVRNDKKKQVRNDKNKEITEKALQLLESFGIAHLADQYPQNLSGGENHRVLIARALMNDPKIILADEATDSVDEENTKEILKIFRNLADQGKIVIFVSHDKAALKLCDKIIKID